MKKIKEIAKKFTARVRKGLSKRNASAKAKRTKEVYPLFDFNRLVRERLSKNAIRFLFSLGFGKEKAVYIGDRGKNGFTQRQARSAASELREHGIPVCNVGDGAGYYLPRPDREIEITEYRHTIQQLRSKARKMIRCANEMSKSSASLRPLSKREKLIILIAELEMLLAEWERITRND